MSRRHRRIAGTGHDCPPEFFSYRDDAPALFERAERAVFERRVGETCDDVMGHERPAEVAVLRWLASLLKVDACPERLSEGGPLIADWRNEIISNLDVDEIEGEAEKLDEED